MALLAKQVWRLRQNHSSLVAKLLKARHYRHCDILDAILGSCPRFTWRSLWGARDLIIGGSRWLLGDGRVLNIWESRWLPRPFSFRPNTAKPINPSVWNVSDLINARVGYWRESIIKKVFVPCDVDTILSIPLCTSWPRDKLIWHFESNEKFSVRLAYHL